MEQCIWPQVKVLLKRICSLMSIENNALRTEVTGDTIVDADPGRSRLTLLNRSMPVTYDDTLLLLKGKLLTPNQVKSRDEAYLLQVTRLTER